MRFLFTLAVVVGAMATISTTAEAQVYNDGYQWGAGVAQGAYGGSFRRGRFFGRRALGPGFGPTPRVDDIPYFAKFPPVYYSGIVKRPYGISPFAAPPGIVPVELTIPVPEAIDNPYFNAEPAAPVTEEPADEPKSDDASQKVTWQQNPYVGVMAAR